MLRTLLLRWAAHWLSSHLQQGDSTPEKPSRLDRRPTGSRTEPRRESLIPT